jgi:hypothetical protein
VFEKSMSILDRFFNTSFLSTKTVSILVDLQGFEQLDVILPEIASSIQTD